MLKRKKISAEIEIEKFASEHYGVEYEEDDYDADGDDDVDEPQPFDPEKIRVDQQMLSLKYVYELMTDGLLNISPDFQRSRVWRDNKRKSRLIESLILRIPIPAFYFYEDVDSKYTVIDGQQRLSTIHEFLNGKFRLTGLEYLDTECRGKKFKDLDPKFKQRIYRTQVAVNIMDARSPKKVIFDIFRRVNTGGVPLNKQEMRNALCSDRVRDFLKSASRCDEFVAATRGKINDNRMDAQEMVLRFVAFYEAYDYEKEIIKSIPSSLVSLLDEHVDILNKASVETLDHYKKIFAVALTRAYALFGEYCFSKITLDASTGDIYPSAVINKSLFSSFTVILANNKFDGLDLLPYRDVALKELADLLEDPDYANSLTIGTGDRARIKTNFNFSNEVIRACQIQ